MPRTARGLHLALTGALLLGCALPSARVHAHLTASSPHDCEIASHAGAGHVGGDGESTGPHGPGCLSCRLTAKPRAAAAGHGPEVTLPAASEPGSAPAAAGRSPSAPDTAVRAPRAPPAPPLP